jgi:hypothetical protein
MEDGLRAYAKLVVERERGTMAAGKASPETWAAYNQLWRTYHEFKPEDDHQRTWYAESIQRLSALGDHRRIRLLSVRSGVPAVIWMVLLGAGAITISCCFLFGTRDAWVHRLMTAAVAITIGGVLLSIFALQQSFAGISRVSPHAFEQVVEIINEQSRSAADHVPKGGWNARLNGSRRHLPRLSK